MTKVRIEMDETWRWWPVTEKENAWRTCGQVFVPTFEIDQALIDRYAAAHREYREIQEQLEQLYRIEQGLDPWPGTPIPEHTSLKAVHD